MLVSGVRRAAAAPIGGRGVCHDHGAYRQLTSRAALTLAVPRRQADSLTALTA